MNQTYRIKFSKLVAYEWKKNFQNRRILIIVIAFLFINLWKINVTWAEESDFNGPNFQSVYQEYYDILGGTITEDKIKTLISIYQPLRELRDHNLLTADYDEEAYTYSTESDEIFWRQCFYDEMQYDYLYENYVHQLLLNVQDNLNFYQSIGNEYEYQKNLNLWNLFEGRKITEYVCTDVYRICIYYDFSVVLIVLLCIFSISGIFVMECESDMFILLHTSKNGWRRTTAAKLCAAFLFVCGSTWIFWIEDFLIVLIRTGMKFEFGGPLYGLAAFANTPLRLNLFQSLLWFDFLKMLGILGFCLTFLLISNFLHYFISSFIVGLGLALLLGTAMVTTTVNVLASAWNPMKLFLCRELYQWSEYISFLGCPLRRDWYEIGLVLLEEIVIIILIFAVNSRRAR